MAEHLVERGGVAVFVIELIRRTGTEALATWPEEPKEEVVVARELARYYQNSYRDDADVICVRLRRVESRR